MVEHVSATACIQTLTEVVGYEFIATRMFLQFIGSSEHTLHKQRAIQGCSCPFYSFSRKVYQRLIPDIWSWNGAYTSRT